MKNKTEKYLKNQRRTSIERLRRYRNWVKQEENEIRFIDKCLEELEENQNEIRKRDKSKD